MALIQLIYISAAHVSLTKPEILELLKKSKENNARTGLTGLLLYKDGNFLQVLEGEEPAVMTLFEKICADPRHGGVQRLLKGPLAKREFTDWSMAFRDLSDPALHSLPAFSEFLNVSLDDRALVEDPSRAQRLLAVFRDSAR